jgi:uncharacterized protein (DUF2384 family)
MTLLINAADVGRGAMAISGAERMKRETTSDIIEDARRIMGLSYNQIANLLDVTRKTLYRYRVKETAPKKKESEQRVEQVNVLNQFLKEEFTSEEAAQEWLYTSVRAFKWRRPIDLIRDGEINKVVTALANMNTGAFL